MNQKRLNNEKSGILEENKTEIFLSVLENVASVVIY